MKKTFVGVAAGMLCMGLLASAQDAAQPEPGKWRVSAGFDYSKGDYGDDEDTKIVAIPMSVSYAKFPWTGKLSIPYLEIDGPGVVVGGADGRTIVEGAGGTTESSGLGDTVASLMYSFDTWSENAPYVDVTAKVKIPTGDEDEDLGTGAFDYRAQVDLAQPMGDWMPYGTLGYQVFGSSDDYDLDNRFYLSLGTDYRITKATRVGLVYDFKQAASEDNVSEASAYVSHKLNAEWTVNAYTVAGFSDGSPDWALGSQVSRKF